jgi:hypothetical protein
MAAFNLLDDQFSFNDHAAGAGSKMNAFGLPSTSSFDAPGATPSTKPPSFFSQPSSPDAQNNGMGGGFSFAPGAGAMGQSSASPSPAAAAPAQPDLGGLLKEIQGSTDPTQAAVKRDQLARTLYTQFRDAGHDVKWQGDQLIVDGRPYVVAGGNGVKPTPGGIGDPGGRPGGNMGDPGFFPGGNMGDPPVTIGPFTGDPIGPPITDFGDPGGRPGGNMGDPGAPPVLGKPVDATGGRPGGNMGDPGGRPGGNMGDPPINTGPFIGDPIGPPPMSKPFGSTDLSGLPAAMTSSGILNGGSRNDRAMTNTPGPLDNSSYDDDQHEQVEPEWTEQSPVQPSPNGGTPGARSDHDHDDTDADWRRDRPVRAPPWRGRQEVQ